MKESNYSIFDIYNPDGNDMLSKLYGKDLQKFLVLLDDMYIKFRSSLNFSYKNSFGIELEFGEANIKNIKNSLIGNWIFKEEETVKNGAEVNSPIMMDNGFYWTDLYRMCDMLKNNSEITESCSLHIHCGAHILGDNIRHWINFIKLVSVYENIMYRFGYGEYLSYRSAIKCHALPFADRFYKIYELYRKYDFDLDVLIYKLKYIRQQSVNFRNVNESRIDDFCDRNTIEFRFSNGTLEPAIIQNTVNFFLSLMNYSVSSNFDYDIVNSRYKKVSNGMSNLVFYNEIYIEQALELCDMIFNKNIDKLYFLRQYFKSFEISSDYKKAKSFIKSI